MKCVVSDVGVGASLFSEEVRRGELCMRWATEGLFEVRNDSLRS